MQMASEICPPKQRTTHTTKDILVSRQLYSLYTALFPNRYEKHQEVGGNLTEWLSTSFADFTDER